MKITKRQLKRIIKEYGTRPYDPTIPGDFDRARDNPTGDAPPGGDFDAKLEKMADEIGMMTEGRTLREQYHSMSPAGKSLSRSIKGKFTRMYPDAKVGIDGRGGFITVNGVKAVDMSQATGRGMSDEEMIDKMHAVYAQTQVDGDVPTADSRMATFREGKMKITKRQLRRIIKEERTRLLKEMRPGVGDDELIDGEHDGALMDLDDHDQLAHEIGQTVNGFMQMGYNREDVIYTIKTIIGI